VQRQSLRVKYSVSIVLSSSFSRFDKRFSGLELRRSYFVRTYFILGISLGETRFKPIYTTRLFYTCIQTKRIKGTTELNSEPLVLSKL